jgi:RNA polymerase primary sigma factor
MRQLKISHSITIRESESLQKYLSEINKIKLLSPEEEVQLFIRVKKGDKSAMDQLVKSNLRFVVSVAKQYQHQGLPLSDLIDEGNIGLIRAVERFDISRGFKFISFAVWWIRQSIIQALAAHSRLIRIPLNKSALQNRLRRASDVLEQQLERMPTEDELAVALEIPAEEIKAGMNVNDKLISLDTPLAGDEECTWADVVENKEAEATDKKVCQVESLQQELNRLMQVLNPRQKETICFIFGIGVDHPMTLEEVSRKLMVTTERVRQIKDAAINKLRSVSNLDVLSTYIAA